MPRQPSKIRKISGFSSDNWAGVDGEIGAYIQEECGRTLQSYRAQPNYVLEHANHEQDTARGGYANRQLFELVQNGADALSQKRGRIEIRLTDSHLYCADSGEGIDKEGVKALMFSYLSPKRGTDEIGRFGLGFKSVLGVSDKPEFFSRSGSFRFDKHRAQQMIQRQLPESQAERYPVLRLAFPLDPSDEASDDPVLRSLMFWANNIVRLPLVEGAYQKLKEQADDFPAEFLLFVNHVERLDIRVDDVGSRRTLTLSEYDGELHLYDEDKTTKWKTFHKMHQLSDEARADSRTLDDATTVPIWWAVPLEGNNPARSFWAFFPTSTPSLVPGIINAPWKTNEDRQNLLTGVYNDELVQAAANLIAENLHHLSTPEDPAKHLDALPRRERSFDRGHAVAMSDRLFQLLYGSRILPDITGALRRFDELRYPPVEIVATRRTGSSRSEPALTSWYEANRFNDDWLHLLATQSQRWTSVERLCNPEGILATDSGGTGTPKTEIDEWLEALVQGVPDDHLIFSSKSAIQTSVLIPQQVRRSASLGSIVLTKDGTLRSLESDIYLPSYSFDADFPYLVHDALARDINTRENLIELGVKEISPEAQFEVFFDRVKRRMYGLDAAVWERIWELAREVPMFAANKIKNSVFWSSWLCVKTIDGNWEPANSALLTGAIVPDSGVRDGDVAIHPEFHLRYETLIRNLDISDRPHYGWDFSTDLGLTSWQNRCRNSFVQNASLYAANKPRESMLNFTSTTGIGPLTVLERLSNEGAVAYTEFALMEEELDRRWTMQHNTRADYYQSISFYQPIIEAIREHGRIRTSEGSVPFADALGENPKSREAQRWLLEHRNNAKIRDCYPDLHEPAQARLVAINAANPVRIVEEYPGLSRHIPRNSRNLDLIRCDQIEDEHGNEYEKYSAVVNDELLVIRTDRERELDAIDDELNLSLGQGEKISILNEPTEQEIEAQRQAIRDQSDDASKLLSAVGESALREELPQALTDYYVQKGGSFDGIEVAHAAISTFHTGALKRYRRHLEHLKPPKQWGGSSGAIQFVTDLGFSPEWAGERGRNRDPFVEVLGPVELPHLHLYQTITATKLRQMLRSRSTVWDSRRGMISLPTGAGKTRIAVEGIVTAITEEGFDGGILWVADRDELCEQAVESWQQVWRAIGSKDKVLRISRMWGGLPEPEPTSERHVVVATVQTLSSKFKNQVRAYDFLRDFKLIVFDEAHRSIAPTFTSVMDELGFTRRYGQQEPFLLGLTATPYRGYNVEETRWLTNRYGRNRLDKDAFGTGEPDAEVVMRELQDMKVLARADHREIQGIDDQLRPDELAATTNTPWLPRSAEIRIARNAGRTQRIIDAYMEHVASKDDAWPTLIFATSVEHAQTLAAILDRQGISARSVSGDTDRFTRRQVVEDFRNGDLNVLVNYGVFREGFDAPKTRAIIVARPVYSPNLYFQMIGRGLRGIKNGGNNRCLILDVDDNIMNFNRKLAFTELDWLWDERSPRNLSKPERHHAAATLG